jgi:hypothetical protein
MRSVDVSTPSLPYFFLYTPPGGMTSTRSGAGPPELEGQIPRLPSPFSLLSLALLLKRTGKPVISAYVPQRQIPSCPGTFTTGLHGDSAVMPGGPSLSSSLFLLIGRCWRDGAGKSGVSAGRRQSSSVVYGNVRDGWSDTFSCHARRARDLSSSPVFLSFFVCGLVSGSSMTAQMVGKSAVSAEPEFVWPVVI